MREDVWLPGGYRTGISRGGATDGPLQYYELSEMQFSFNSVYVVILIHERGTPLWSAVT